MAYATTPSTGLPDRMMRAARLNIPLYEEVEADTTATNQALLVVVIVALASGIGAALGATMSGAGANPLGSLIGGIISALIGWAVWSFVIYFVGTRMFGGTATYGEVLRTLGFAETPGILTILSFIPIIGGLLSLVAFVWTLVASFIATRQALDISNGKTVGTIVVAICVLLVVLFVLALIFGTIFGLGMLLGGGLRQTP